MVTGILIPAYQPSVALADVVRSIRKLCNHPILVVDDGSSGECASVFEQAAQSGAEVICHAVNIGKGAALKTGINYLLTHYPEIERVVTVDADGQHAPEDVVRLIDVAEQEPDHLVLGSRSFGNDIPLRSWLGNQISRGVYWALLGLKMKDTQTGLRVLPRDLAAKSLTIRSNRYEFETEQLSLASSLQFPLREEDIQTIYEPGNPTSHFNPFLDSLRIYFVILRYAMSSIVTALVDLIAFTVFVSVLPSIILANLGCRAVAMGVQFLLLRSFVFHAPGAAFLRFALFVAYVMGMGFVSGVLQVSLSDATGIGPLPSKISVEAVIFVFNFLFLRDILFARSAQ